MALGTQNVYINSGIRRIFNCWCSDYSANIKSILRFFHISLQGARNINNESLLVGSVITGKRCQVHVYKNAVSYVQKERKILYSSSTSALEEEKAHSLTGPLTKLQAHDLIMRLTGEERTALLTALQEFQSEKRKAEYEATGVLRGKWTKILTARSFDKEEKPFQSRAEVAEENGHHGGHAESVPSPSSGDLWRVSVHNAVPFVGFGFLDNFIMIIAGEQIEMMLGSVMVLSTMAAAALGNTISDIMGIGSAWYVERLAARIGMRPPKLSPIQLDMPSSRRAANMGRALGVTLGCLLGMIPLLFLGKKKDESNEDEPT
ncbi:transmembrane protein 65 isoform X2 [Cryptotermes secundus]|uniref:transmembrane protein 65 isoform X2 n=1 Tax=Cryptotermes secundus TaxID=105785 RepID=UPI001454BB61|nr:transmembrane protein 65 isoform X2 [Cryptotermes secundus]